MSGEEPAPQMAPVESPQMISTIKLPILKKGEYTLWSIRMEQYLTNTNYGLWQVILNGDKHETQQQKIKKCEPYQLRFHTIKDAKSLWAAIKSRFGGNVESKKMQKNVLNQLEVHGAAVSNEDANQKFLRALPSSWNNIAFIMRNKEGIDELDIDDLYNNLKVFEADIKGSSGSSSNSQNRPYHVLTKSRLNVLTVIEGAILPGNVEHQEIKGTGMEMQGIGSGTTPEGQLTRRDPSLMHGYSYQLGLESVEAQLIVHQKNEVVYEEKIAVLEFEVNDKGYGDQLNENDSSGSELFNSVFDSHLSDGDDNQTNDRFKKDNGYHVVPPPLTGNYMPPLADLSFAGFVRNARVESVGPSGVIIERRVSDDDEDIFQSNDVQTTVKPSIKKIEFTKARNEPVKSDKQAIKPRMVTQSPKRMPKESVLGKGTGHREIRPIWNNTQRINHQNKFVPTAVLTRSGRIPVILNNRVSKEKVNTVRVNGVNTAGQTSISTIKRNGVTAVKASAGCVWRAKMTDLNNGSKDNSGSWISKRGNPQQALKYKGMFDSGCSRHMTRNKALLTDYQDIDGGFVAFGGSTRGGKITGIGKMRTNKINFEDVFFMKELKFNLFSISQMYDKKNSVLFTETECLVLSPDFKLIDESQVLLRVPRQNNMYNFDLKNVVPSGDLTCLFAKATIDESK
ncbi:hypothetical protein Tco_0916786, partial [Tanacetum coccineum]